MKIFKIVITLYFIFCLSKQCGVIEKSEKEIFVTINNKKTSMVPLEECDEDELIEGDCSNLFLVQPDKGLFFIDENH